MMRVLILSQGFNPEPHFKGLSFARELQRQGFSVQVLTGFPNYPGGKVYPGYKIKFIQRETLDGVEIIRVPLYPSHDSSPIKRIATYISFALSAAFIGTWFVRRADALYIYHPPASTAFAGLILRIFRAKKTIYDIQDLWPDTLKATGMLNNEFILKLVGHWCNFTYRWVDHIVVLSQGFKKRLVSRGVPEQKISVIYNWADEAAERTYEKNPKLADELGFTGRFNVIFEGQMGKAQALTSVLEAAEIVKLAEPKIQFVFIGGGIEKSSLESQARERLLSNVKFLSAVPITEIGHRLTLADVLLVHLKNDPLFEITIPSKTQGYLSEGRPILMAVPGEAGEIIETAHAGIRALPQDPQSIADSVLKLYRMSESDRAKLGENGLNFYREQMSLSRGVNYFSQLFKIS